MTTTKAQRRIFLKDGTYFNVDAEAKSSDHERMMDYPEKTGRTWSNSDGDVVAFCWLENIVAEKFIP